MCMCYNEWEMSDQNEEKKKLKKKQKKIYYSFAYNNIMQEVFMNKSLSN